MIKEQLLISQWSEAESENVRMDATRKVVPAKGRGWHGYIEFFKYVALDRATKRNIGDCGQLSHRKVHSHQKDWSHMQRFWAASRLSQSFSPHLPASQLRHKIVPWLLQITWAAPNKASAEWTVCSGTQRVIVVAIEYPVWCCRFVVLPSISRVGKYRS